MTTVTSEAAFETSIEAHLVDNGWRAGTSGDYDVRLGLVPDEVVAFLRSSQPEEWIELVSRLGGEPSAREKVLARIAEQIDKRGTLDVLRRETKLNGVAFRLAFFAPANGLVQLLWDRYRANRLTVIRQLHHSESNTKASVDLALFVNGLPVATAELKGLLTRQDVRDAMKQYQHDRTPSDLIFRARTLVHFAVDQHQVYMTTRLAGERTRFLPFNQGSGGAGEKGSAGNPPGDGYRTAYLWEQVWERDAWLELLGEYVHVEDVYDSGGRRTGDTITLFPRYHQWDAVRQLLVATKTAGPAADRLVEHSAGSGKSNTIAWTAHQLSRLHTPSLHGDLTDELTKAGLGTDQPIFHKVVVITDRRALDRQLQSTIAGFEHTPGTIVKIDEDSQQLRDALAGNAARVVITTLQKFPVVAEMATREGGRVAGQRFAVIVDEAHSSTSGDSLTKLKSVLGVAEVDLVPVTADEAADPLTVQETADARADDDAGSAVDLLAASMAARGSQANIAFFAFTATPKPKTLNLFGEKTIGPDGKPVHTPFHLYSMRQAIEEEFILDVLANYVTYGTYYKLGRRDSAADPDVPKGKTAAVLARYVSLHPTNVSQKVEIIVEHFREHTAGKIGGHAKAMVVTRSRLHAVRYKQALDAYIATQGYTDVATLVAFSGTVTDDGDPGGSWTEAGMNGFSESQLPRQFGTDDYQLLVVAEKYQTGFDQPLLHTMYVDKKLSGVGAVQTLSRLNRTHPGKSETFVLDFANDGEEIQDAFRPFFEQTTAEPTDPNLLYEMDRTLRDAGVIDRAEQQAAVTALLSGGAAQQQAVYANLNPAVDRFVALDDEDQTTLRDTLSSYLRAYAFLAQIMPWTDADLESLYLYGRALRPLLPAVEGEALPQISEAVLLTHLRTEARGEVEHLSLVYGSDEPGVALPGGGMGQVVDPPLSRLSELIADLNERYGLNLTEADKVWFEQQKQAIKDDEKTRQVALNNDRDQYRVVLEDRAEEMIVERHEANGELFSAFFDKPGFRESLLEYLAESYDEIRGSRAS